MVKFMNDLKKIEKNNNIWDFCIRLIKKFCTKEIIFYGIFGVLTTIVNLGAFYILTNFFNTEENIANIVGIVLAVIFAYLTNRKLVFNSTAETFKEKSYEFLKFIIGRVFTMILEAIGFFLLFNICNINKIISKLAIMIIVIILNFFISKFFTFKK